jgi:hypothetical protein
MEFWLPPNGVFGSGERQCGVKRRYTAVGITVWAGV